MSVEEKMALVRHIIEEANKGKGNAITVMDKFYANDFVIHGGTGEEIHGLNNWKQHYSELLDAIPDLHLIIDDMVVEGDKVAVRWTITGTHRGVLRGIPPTNKKVKTWGIQIYRFAGGRLMEIWERYDTLSTMQQLGAVPS